MGWVLCIVFLVNWAISQDTTMIIASAIFAIAGSVSEVARKLDTTRKE